MKGKLGILGILTKRSAGPEGLTRLRINALSTRTSSSKIKEEPVIVVAENSVDIIGPPDAFSNLRPVIRKRHPNETTLEKTLREMQDSTHVWNHSFWEDHNNKFLKGREAFIKEKQTGKGADYQLSSEEMSEFYRKFLDENWKKHAEYNVHWYRRNLKILCLSFRVNLDKYLSQIKGYIK